MCLEFYFKKTDYIVGLRYVDFMWSLFLIDGHVHLNGIYMTRFVVKHGHQKGMCYVEFETILNSIGRACVIT